MFLRIIFLLFAQCVSLAAGTQALLPRTTIVLPAINKIYVHGLQQTDESAVRHSIPYREGQPFDRKHSNSALRSLYKLGNFRSIELKGEDLSDGTVNLYVIVEEKPKLREVKFVGNEHLTEKEINKKVDFSKLHSVDEQELKKFAQIITRMYAEKGYHFATITPGIEYQDGAAVVTFTITEGKHSVVRRVDFTGNKRISAKKLRAMLFTREDWLLNFLDASGIYHPQAIEMDRFTIETFYKNNGFIHGKVTDVGVVMNEKTKDFDIKFSIEEGERYTVGDITAPGNDILTEEELLSVLPLQKGMIYSQALIQKSLEILRNVWGNRGYVFADVDPSIQPNDETKAVNIAFYSDLGSKVRINRINIVGNKKTRDYVIRRQVTLQEGDLLTSANMEASKNRAELLGYFDKRQGVNWKINRVSDELADLDLIVKEIRTGHFTLQASTNGSFSDVQNPLHVLTVTIGYGDSNLLGRGINTDVTVALSRGEQSGNFTIGAPWLFGKPISGMFNAHATAQQYEDIRAVQQTVRERRFGCSGALGFLLNWPQDFRFQLEAGIENLSYQDRPKAVAFETASQDEYQRILNSSFQPGTYGWVTASLDQDLRNHPQHPSGGHHWNAYAKWGLPSESTRYGYIKFDGDFAWYTPLIGTADLILCAHAHLGIAHPMVGHTVPYRELYHIGGPATVRGFLFGQIGPMWKTDSIGASKAFWVNVETIFPIRPDFSMKGAFFYDGGAGWDTPVPINPLSPNLHNNRFRYRHSVGVGIRILSPVPIQIDWGFKLDRNKKIGETLSELHLGMNHNF